MTQSIDSADDDSALAATLNSVDALSHLLALNSAVEQARSEIETPFSISANRVTERVNPIGRHRLRSVAAPAALAIELGRARAAVIAGGHLIEQPIEAEPFAADGLGR